MNLILIIFLSGLLMKVVFSFVEWLWNVASSENRWTNASKQVAELGKLGPEQYLRIRSGASRKVRHLAPVSGLTHIQLAGPPAENKKSA